MAKKYVIRSIFKYFLYNFLFYFIKKTTFVAQYYFFTKFIYLCFGV